MLRRASIQRCRWARRRRTPRPPTGGRQPSRKAAVLWHRRRRRAAATPRRGPASSPFAGLSTLDFDAGRFPPTPPACYQQLVPAERTRAGDTLISRQRGLTERDASGRRHVAHQRRHLRAKSSTVVISASCGRPFIPYFRSKRLAPSVWSVAAIFRATVSGDPTYRAEALADTRPWVENFSPGAIKSIGIVEFVGPRSASTGGASRT